VTPRNDYITAFCEALSKFINTPGMTMAQLQERSYAYMSMQWAAQALLRRRDG
jgi:hypothetical protein